MDEPHKKPKNRIVADGMSPNFWVLWLSMGALASFAVVYAYFSGDFDWKGPATIMKFILFGGPILVLIGPLLPERWFTDSE